MILDRKTHRYFERGKKSAIRGWEKERQRRIFPPALRIDEPLYLKLKSIARGTPYSMNSFILDRAIDEIEEEIIRLAE